MKYPSTLHWRTWAEPRDSKFRKKHHMQNNNNNKKNETEEKEFPLHLKITCLKLLLQFFMIYNSWNIPLTFLFHFNTVPKIRCYCMFGQSEIPEHWYVFIRPSVLCIQIYIMHNIQERSVWPKHWHARPYHYLKDRAFCQCINSTYSFLIQ